MIMLNTFLNQKRITVRYLKIRLTPLNVLKVFTELSQIENILDMKTVSSEKR